MRPNFPQKGNDSKQQFSGALAVSFKEGYFITPKISAFLLLMFQKSQTTTVWMYETLEINGISTNLTSTGE